MAKLVNRFIALLCLFGAIILIIMSSRRLFEQQQVLVQTPAVLVHQQPDLATKAVAKLKKGMHLDVVGRRTHWYQVRLNRRQSGWIRSDQINALAVRRMQQQDARHSNKGTVVSTNKTIEIITDQANTKLRAKPATKGKILAVLPKNKKLGLIKRSGNWYKVRTNDNQVGYVASWIVTEQAKLVPIHKPASLATATIVLDPGHGGSDSGAISGTGQFEKTYTLKVAKLTAQKLRRLGTKVVLTRTSDHFVSLAKRPQIANQLKADAFISFHFDSSGEQNDASGFTTYYYQRQKDTTFAKTINRNLDRLPLPNKGIRYGNFQVLRDNQRPAILLEMGYINTTKDFKRIKSAKYRDQIATQVVKGLQQYFDQN